MAYFTLEALPARYGDCLMLHFGTKAKPGLVLIDGGPSQVWTPFLKPRLDALRTARGNNFRIDLLMLSHIDDDHLIGIIDFTTAWKTAKAAGQAWPFPVSECWHNSFERIAGSDDLSAVTASVLASTGGAPVDSADLTGLGLGDDKEARAALKVLASVGKGAKLRADIAALGIKKNTGFDKLVKAGTGPQVPYALGPKLRLHVVGPLEDQLTALQRKFAEELPKGPGASLAAYADDSVPNLSSIAAVASYEGKSILLTGDARGDYLLEGLEAEGLLTGGKLHVDILKLPHHGSDRNVEEDFFRDITADHYVASADGTYGNPDRAALEMLIAARPKTARYTIHLTYPLATIDAKRRDEWDKDRASAIKKKLTKPGTKVPREWDSDRDDLATLFARKKAEGYAFVVSAPAALGPSARVDLLQPISF